MTAPFGYSAEQVIDMERRTGLEKTLAALGSGEDALAVLRRSVSRQATLAGLGPALTEAGVAGDWRGR